MGVLITHEGRESKFWYPCPDKRQAQDVIETHKGYHPGEQVSAAWVTKWHDGKPVDPETIA